MLRSALLVLSVAVVACGSGGGATAPGGGSGGAAAAPVGGSGGAAGAPSTCVPGRQDPCVCPSGPGARRCREDGRSYDACVCSGVGGAAGAGGVTAVGGAAGSGGVTVADDADGDGFTVAQGDCNDADASVGPNAFEALGDAVDNDCNGVVDDPPVPCDNSLDFVAKNPLDAARALGLCAVGVAKDPKTLAERKPGVLDVRISDISGPYLTSPPQQGASPELQIGLLPSLGAATVPFEGGRFLALSSGIARAPGQPGHLGKEVCTSSLFAEKKSSYPPGFPKKAACDPLAGSGVPGDAIAIDMLVRAPVNARSFRFDFRFFTCEYPNYVCKPFNDVFAVLMSPSPLAAGDIMTDESNTTANVAFESTGAGSKSVIGVNNTSFLTVCENRPFGPTIPYVSCAGNEALVGSGFDGRGASGWLESRVPVPAFAPGEDRLIYLRFAIWDSTDQIQDSTAIVDRFRWSTDELTDAVTFPAVE